MPELESASVGLLGVTITQAIDTPLVEALVSGALELVEERPVPNYTQLAMPRYLNNRAWSTMAGSNEVMRTLIAKTVLGV